MADSARDFCNKTNIAQKEAGETVYWLNLLAQAELGPESVIQELAAEAIELRKICRQIVRASRSHDARK